MNAIKFQRKIEFIDLTKEEVTAHQLVESKIECVAEDKVHNNNTGYTHWQWMQEYYVYYFLQRYQGRTIIFVNAISCIHRLVSLLGLLQLPVCSLHSNMQQKQRLKNLERFQASSNAVLISTDVAARGLDIPNIEHVVHYQLPRTVEVCTLIAIDMWHACAAVCAQKWQNSKSQ